MLARLSIVLKAIVIFNGQSRGGLKTGTLEQFLGIMQSQEL